MNITKRDLNFFKKIILLKTTHTNKEDIDKCLLSLEQRFSKSFSCKEKYSYKNRKMLVLSNTKYKKVNFIFSGHIDVVSADQESFSLKENKDKFFGRGVLDMKGPLFFMLLAVEEFLKKYSGKLKIAILITADEEVDGLSAKYLINKEKYFANFAIIPDGGFNEDIVIKQKGFMQVKVIVNGKSSHASRPWEGVNAIERSINIYQSICEKFPMPKKRDNWKTSVVMTAMKSGEDINQVPKRAEFILDIRYVSTEDRDEIIKKIKKQVTANEECKVIAENGILRTDEKNEYLVAFRKALQKKVKKKVSFIKTNSTSDAIFFSDKGIPVVLFYPIGGGNHQSNEWIEKKSLEGFYYAIIDFLNSYK